MKYLLFIMLTCCGAKALRGDKNEQTLEDAEEIYAGDGSVSECPAVVVPSGPPAPTMMMEEPPPPPPEPRKLVIKSPRIDVPAYSEFTYCHYFRTDEADLAVTKWTSTTTGPVVRFELFTSAGPYLGGPSTNCDTLDGIYNLHTLRYSSAAEHEEVVMPSDDGEGRPVAMELTNNSAALLWVHVFNIADTPMSARVELVGELLEPDVAFTRASTFLTINTGIQIPGGSTNDYEVNTCPVPTGAKFFHSTVSTFDHARYGAIMPGPVSEPTPEVFSMTDPSNPGSISWDGPVFPTFGGWLTTGCSYAWPGVITLEYGSNPSTKERCISINHYFPAERNKGAFCMGSFLLP